MHRFSPEKAHKLENSERYGLLRPEKTLVQFGLREGMTFVDIGAGTGFFSRAASAIVGETGTVYAVDISSEMLNAFRQYGVPENVQLIESDMFNIPRPSATVDMTLFAFVLHESEDIRKSLNEAKRTIKVGGRIAVIEWKKQAEQKGPPMEERLAMDDLLAQTHGLSAIASGDLNPSHYYCILQIN